MFSLQKCGSKRAGQSGGALSCDPRSEINVGWEEGVQESIMEFTLRLVLRRDVGWVVTAHWSFILRDKYFISYTYVPHLSKLAKSHLGSKIQPLPALMMTFYDGAYSDMAQDSPLETVQCLLAQAFRPNTLWLQVDPSHKISPHECTRMRTDQNAHQPMHL